MSVVTRFPPSPTGFMHIGTARTALFNWLYARKHGGKMLFRIEDTDRKRHNEDAVENLIKGLEWLGLDWDGAIVSQYEQRARHAEVAKELLANGKAYYCYCSPEELDEMREECSGGENDLWNALEHHVCQGGVNGVSTLWKHKSCPPRCGDLAEVEDCGHWPQIRTVASHAVGDVLL